MATIVREERYIMADLTDGKNHNKFWDLRIYEDGSVESYWGRVGEPGKTTKYGYLSESKIQSKIGEKTRKGYKKQQTLNSSGTTTIKAVETKDLRTVAQSQIKSDSSDTQQLIDFLVQQNKHQILSATELSYDAHTGLFATPLGIVQKDAIDNARGLLIDISGYIIGNDVDNRSFEQLVSDYLNVIPMVIPRYKPSAKTIFNGLDAVKKQNDVLDSLEVSLQMALSGNNKDKDVSELTDEKVFEVKLMLNNDPKLLNEVKAYYANGSRSMHQSSYLKISRIFDVEIKSMHDAFTKVKDKYGNVKKLWHGTKTANLLSIMKSGMFIPKQGGSIQVTGRMFGDGLYFSDISTKSLNYSDGYWSGSGRSGHCFMFLCHVAMGKEYIPNGSYSYSERYPKSGYDSTFAKSGVSGVQNNEMIVYTAEQVDLVHLIEFKG